MNKHYCIFLFIILTASCVKPDSKINNKCQNSYIETRLIELFLSHPLSHSYLPNKQWKKELLVDKWVYSIENQINIYQHIISESKDTNVPFTLIHFSGTNCFSYMFPFMDKYYFHLIGKQLNYKNKCYECIAEFYDNIFYDNNLEIHLNFIIENESWFQKDSSYSEYIYKIKKFIDVIMSDVLGTEKIGEHNISLLDNQFNQIFENISDAEKNKIIEYHDFVKRNIDTQLFYISNQLIYFIKLPSALEDKINIEVLNKEWFYLYSW